MSLTGGGETHQPTLLAADRAQRWRPSKRAHIISDVAVFVFFVALSAPTTTGLTLHEWLVVPFVPIFLSHLITSWPWITAMTRRSAHPRGRPRTNRALDIALFATTVTATYSGLAISGNLLPSLGLDVAPRDFWVTVHSASATLLVPVIAAHLYLHWQWVRRNVLRRRGATGARS